VLASPVLPPLPAAVPDSFNKQPSSSNVKSFMALKMKAKQNNMNEIDQKIEIATNYTQMPQT
jgi:hypothetical protein